MTNKHTQGGWVAMQANLSRDNKWLVCEARSYGEGICQLPSEANARLIAASPDMLNALEQALICLRDPNQEDANALERQIEAAITKARGEV